MTLKQFAKSLVEYRTKRGLTQTELANLVKAKQNTISGWESGEVKPQASARERIAKILKIEVAA